MNTRTLAVAIGAVCASALAAVALALHGALAPKAEAAPDFTLIDARGAPFALSSQRGRPVAIFFGYAHCADACPVVLANLAKAVRRPEAPPDVRVLFVTVDPARDTPAALGRYVAAFDRSFVGLTGSAARLEPVYAAYHITRIASTGGPQGSLEIAHETAVFLIDRRGALHAVVPGDDASDLAAALRDDAR